MAGRTVGSNPGGAGRLNLGQNVRRADGAEIDTFDSQISGTLVNTPTDSVRIGSYEANFGDGFYGGRFSTIDAQESFLGDRVTLSGTGPSAELQGGFQQNEQGDHSLAFGASVGLGGVAATGQLGDERNNIRGTVGIGLGAGFEVENSSNRNEDGSRTNNFNLEAKLLGRFAVGGTWTTAPTSGLSGRNLRGRQLAEQRLAQQALNGDNP